MRWVIGLFFFFGMISAEGPPDPIFNLEGDVGSIVAGRVNAIYGDLVESSIDLSIPALEPLFFHRLYLKPRFNWNNLWTTWEHNFMRGMVGVHKPKTFDNHLRFKEITIRDEGGSTFRLHGDTGDSTTLHFKLSKATKALTNVGRGYISGRTNMVNTEFKFDCGMDCGTLTSGGGVERKYIRSYSEGSAVFYDEKSEKRPSGYEFFFGEKKAEQKISLRSPNTKKLIGQFEIKTPPLSKNNTTVEVKSSIGQVASFRFNLITKKVPVYALDQVVKPNGLIETYSYYPEEKQAFLKEKRLTDGRYYRVVYFEPGDNEVGSNYITRGQETIHVRGNEFFVGRVRALYEPAGPMGKEVKTHRFVYKEKYTEHYDALNHATLFHYSENNRLTKVYRLHGCNITNYDPSYSELLYWGDPKIREDSFLKGRFCYDYEENFSIAKAYDYDSKGNVLKETCFGNFTGTNFSAPLFKQDVGLVNANGAESITKEYRYYEKFNLMEREKLSNGIEFVYSYLSGTDLVTKKLTMHGGVIYRRVFNRYNEDNCLIETIDDDGKGKEASDLTGVVARKITRYVPKATAPCFGFPEEITEWAFNLKTGKEELLTKKRQRYHMLGNIECQEVFDAGNNLCYVLNYEYDASGNCTLETLPCGERIYRQFDLHGNCLYESGPDPRRAITYSFDSMNRCILEVDELGGAISHTYDLAGNRISTTDSFGNSCFFKYDEFNRLIETTYPEVFIDEGISFASKTSQKHDMLGRITKKMDAKGNVVRTFYTAHDKPYLITYPDGTKEEFLYDLFGNCLQETSRTGIKTIRTFDVFGREKTSTCEGATEVKEYKGSLLIAITDAMGVKRTFSYDAAGRIVSESFGNKRTKYVYDAFGRRTRTEQYEGETLLSTFIQKWDFSGRIVLEAVLDSDDQPLSKTSYSYDEAGNVTLIQKGDSYWQYSYDSKGRRTQEIDPLGDVTRTFYDHSYKNAYGQNVLQIRIIDPSGHIRVITHDALGREVKQEELDPFGQLLQEMEIVYDKAGQKTLIKHGSSTTKIIFDSMNRPIKITRGFGSSFERSTCTSFDRYGRKDYVAKPDGKGIRYVYDSRSRIAEIKGTDGSIHYRFSYNQRSELILVEDLIYNTKEERILSDEGYLISEMLHSGVTLNYFYDAMGRLKELKLPDHSSICYHYNALTIKKLQRLDCHQKLSYEHECLSFDTNGNLTSAKLLGESGTVDYAFDPLFRLESVEHTLWTQEEISYDKRSNLTSYRVKSQDEEFTREFTYDSLCQLQSESGGTYTHFYEHASNYNRLQKDGLEYRYNGDYELISDGDSKYSYDLNGNINKIETPEGQYCFSYDIFDRLTKVITPLKTVYYHYDSHGRRISKRSDKTIDYLYFQNMEIGSMVDGKFQDLRLLAQGFGAEIGATVAIEIEGNPYAALHDHSGNITALIDEKGTLVETLEYSAFGETKASLSPWTYKSKRLDPETGWIHFGKRYYIASLGRFSSLDPKGLEGSINPYSYVENRPLTLHDLYGLNTEDQPIIESTSIGRLFEYMGNVVNWIGYGISKFGEHIATVPIIRDLITSAANSTALPS